MKTPEWLSLTFSRDPFSRTVSDFLQKQFISKIDPNISLEEFLVPDESKTRIRTRDNIVANSVYHTFLRRWLRLFDREQIIVGESYLNE